MYQEWTESHSESAIEEGLREMTDIAAEIWNAAVPGDYPKTAEGRAQVDVKLKSDLDAIEDDDVRNHATHLIRNKRIEARDKNNAGHESSIAAAERRGMERAAVIAEGRYKEWLGGSGVSCDVTACEEIAAAIRAELETIT